MIEYESGPAAPDTVVWSVSDTTVLAVIERVADRAVVVGRARGEAYLISLVNGTFTDSALMAVVEPGQGRWRVQISGDDRTGTVALDGQGRAYVVAQNAAETWLTAVDPAGEAVFSVPTCWSFLSPSVMADGASFTTSSSCTRRHSPAGLSEWSVPFGNYDGGVAVDSDGSAVVLHVIDEGDPATVVSRVSPGGTELQRDTIAFTPGMRRQVSAPAIAANGDIYVAWSDAEVSGQNFLTRLSADGTVLWTVPGAGYTYSASPAPLDDRVVISGRAGNLAVYDTSGAMLWRRTWDQSSGGVSSPAVDREGNIYVQSQFIALVSYDRDGTLRWSTDSVTCVACGFSVGAPTLLSNRQLLVPCSRAAGLGVCAVDTVDGSLVWHAVTGGPADGSPAVAPDGTIYVPVYGELIALWGNVPPLTDGWPTEGGGMGRLRRADEALADHAPALGK